MRNFWFTAFFSILVVATPARAILIEVSQESAVAAGDFDENVFGFIEPYSTAQTAAEYYGWNTTIPFSYSGAEPMPVEDESILFFAADGLSLFSIHDVPNDTDGGTATSRFLLSNDTAEIRVQDDDQLIETDRYQANSGTEFIARHEWAGCCTDGIAIGSLDGNWVMELTIGTSSDFLTEWTAISATGNGLPLTFGNQRVRLQPVVAVPEPTTLARMAVGLFGFGFTRRRCIR